MRRFFENRLQALLNRYLALDPESVYRLEALANRVVTIELKGIGFVFQLVFTPTRILLKTSDFAVPDTVITGTPLSLLHLTVTTGERRKFFADDVRIDGNLEVGQAVIHLFDALEIDWEEYLSRLIGDAPARPISRFAREIKQFATHCQKTLLQNTNEYLHEEINLFPPREALQDFFNDVDTLRMDTDRLEARLAQLKQAFAAKQKHSTRTLNSSPPKGT